MILVELDGDDSSNNDRKITGCRELTIATVDSDIMV